MDQAEKLKVRQYLLGQLTESDEEQVELDLLTDATYAEEFDVIVDEITDEYATGQLHGKELEQVENYFLKSADRQKRLAFTQALRRASRERKKEVVSIRDWIKKPFNSYLSIAATVLIVLGVGFGVWRAFIYQSDVDKGLMALNAAYREQRPIEARITALKTYAPFAQTRGPGTNIGNKNDLEESELTLRTSLRKKATPALHHALGEVHLAKREFDDAINEFEEALKGDPRNPKLLSDLGAAWLEKGKVDSGRARNNPTGVETGKDLEDLGRSLDSLSKALELNGGLLEALFNRALCYQYMMLPRQAEADWREYLKKDSNSPWAEEARRNLTLIADRNIKISWTKEQLLKDFLDAYYARDHEKAWRLISSSRDDLAGTNIAQQLLDYHLELSAKGQKEEAESKLLALSYLSDLEVRKADEHYDEKLVVIGRSLTVKQRATLIQARALMKTGYDLYAESRLKEAVDVFQNAALAFVKASDSVEVNHAKYWLAYCSLENIDTERGLDILRDLAPECTQQKYRWLLMRTLHSIAGAKYTVKEYSIAIQYSSRALELAEQLGDQIGAFNELDVLTEIHRSINNYSQALGFIARSQPLLDCCSFHPLKLLRHYSIVASAFYSAGLYTAATEYQREAVQRAIAAGETTMASLCYVHLGLMYGKQGSFAEGLRNTQQAYQIAAAQASEARGKEMMAYSELNMGHLYRDHGDCGQAIASYDNSINLYTNLGLLLQLYQAHKGKLVCYIKEGEVPQATEELRITLNLIEKNRSTIFEGENRNKFFDVEQNVYDLGIAFTYEKLNDSEGAFAYSEDSRARSLLDLLRAKSRGPAGDGPQTSAVSQPLSLSEIKQGLPSGTKILEYSVLPDGTLIWVVGSGGLTVRKADITQAELNAKVAKYFDLVMSQKDDADETRQGKELYDLLIKPIEDLLSPGQQINIVPDKILNSLPFASLVTPSGRFLIQDYCITYSPSSTFFVLASSRANKAYPGHFERLLSVGNPAFDRSEFPFLDDLPTATREAREIAVNYDQARVLYGKAAKKEAVIEGMMKAEVVHLALHAIGNEHSEMHSELVLAKSPNGTDADEGTGTLQAREIYGLNLTETRLVVLSACQTGSGRYYAGEGTFSLARAFLVAGVPVVVASLWPVESESTTELMINVHRFRRQGHLSSAEALKSAQLEMISHGDGRFHRPYYWASFFCLGGSSRL